LNYSNSWFKSWISLHGKKRYLRWPLKSYLTYFESFHTKSALTERKTWIYFLVDDIFEAVRGIFDGRAHLGRKFSVYYYYAKYVSREKLWIDSVKENGLESSAIAIVQTFLSLNNHQKVSVISNTICHTR